MGFKRTNAFHLITSGAMTGTATITSDTIDVTNVDNIGIQLTWTGTPTGTFTVQGSIDETNFYDLTFSPVLGAPAGAAGGFLIDINQFPWPFLKVTYTNASGTGTLQVWTNTKDLN